MQIDGGKDRIFFQLSDTGTRNITRVLHIYVKVNHNVVHYYYNVCVLAYNHTEARFEK